MFRRLWVLLPFVALVVCQTAPAAEEDGLAADLAVLKNASVDSDGPALLAFFKKRTLAEGVRSRIAALIRLLGADEFQVREKATTDLIDIGAIARPMLRPALKDADLEIRRRVGWALEKIGPASVEAQVLPAAARVLGQRKPAGAAQVLLEFLPNIEDPEVADEVAHGLAAVTLNKDGKPDPVVVLALGDRQWIKRYAAAHALIRVGGAAHRPAVRKLLKDADPGVRRRVALALVDARDKEGIPALIALLAAAGDDATAAEEMLNVIAGDKAPDETADDTAAGRARYRKAWELWWKNTSPTLDLAKIDLNGVHRGYTLLTTLDASNMTGKAQELDTSGKARWTITGLRYPIWASMAKRDRVLICEYYGNRVTERDLKGKVIWEKVVAGQILSAKRLANGNTFIAARNLLIEVDRTGAQVKMISRPYDVLAAERHKDGTTTIITSNGQCARLDAAGRQTNQFAVGFLSGIVGFKAHFLPRGGVVVPDYARSKVREYDAAGKLVQEVDATRPNAVTRLPNGHYLICSRFRNQVLELDKTGKVVSTRNPDGRPLFIDRR